MSDNAGILRQHLAAENNHDLAGTLATVLPFVVFVDFRDGLLAGERFQYDLNGLIRKWTGSGVRQDAGGAQGSRLWFRRRVRG